MSSDIVAKRRWERKRELLPNLKLRYPNDYELQKLAELAKVDSLSIFGQHIRSIILDAYLNDSLFKKLSTPKIRKILDSLASQAQQLSTNLRAIDVGSGGSAERAGLLLELELSQSRPNNCAIILPECVDLIQALSDAAKRGKSCLKSKRGPKGAGGNPAFDRFIETLFMAAWQRGGDWTIYRAANQTYTGSLLQALQILRPYLPKFFPREKVGRSVEHARDRFKKLHHK